MKKLLCLIICLLIPFCFAACKDSGENEPVPIELISRTLNDEHEFAIVDDNGEEWITNDDVEKVSVIYKEGEDRYLELHFTKDGAKKFKKAVKKSKDGTLSITLDGESIASPIVANEKNPEYAKFSDKYEVVIDCFNKIT